MAQSRVDKIRVGVINASNFVKKDLENKHLKMGDIIDALKKQLNNHFRPAWGIQAEVELIDDAGPDNCAQMCQRCKPSPGLWWLLILDNSDIAGVLGYHDATPEGLPLAKVFAETAYGYGRPWTVTASHELLEMLADPGMSLVAFKPSSPTEASGRLYAYEVCDPCDDDQYAIGENNILVSNFVYPAWFEWFRNPNSPWGCGQHTQFIHCYDKDVGEPFQLRPGGHINVIDIPGGSGWRQIHKEPYTYNMRPHVGSRRDRRRILASEWVDPPVFRKS